MSLNGYVGGPNGELDWMTWDWDDGIKEYVDELHNTVDTILLGRKMTDGFVEYWTNAVKNPDKNKEEYPFAKKMVDYPKFVFSKTLEKSNWDNTTLVKGDLEKEVNNLKNGQGKDIIVYGGATFVSNLVKAKLIDEYYLFFNPVVIPRGLTIFSSIEGKDDLMLIESIPFECGIVLHHYKPKKI